MTDNSYSYEVFAKPIRLTLPFVGQSNLLRVIEFLFINNNNMVVMLIL
jgi:hypothetical protein